MKVKVVARIIEAFEGGTPRQIILAKFKAFDRFAASAACFPDSVSKSAAFIWLIAIVFATIAFVVDKAWVVLADLCAYHQSTYE